MVNEPTAKRIRLIINADGFGTSKSANRAVERAFREGVLTSASLTVTASQADDAAEVAKRNPRLGVGLHLMLIGGKSALKGTELGGLVNPYQEFGESAVLTGVNYQISRGLKAPFVRRLTPRVSVFD